MDSEFNFSSFEEDFQREEIMLGESARFSFSKKRIYGRMHFLKRPSEKYQSDLLTIESLRKEFAIGYSLDHPNVVRYLRMENDTIFEEYIDGKTLREMIEGNDPKLTNNQFLQIVCLQFLDILGYLLEKGVVHNDIKPENVIVTRIGDTIKLVDFNCAQSSDNDILGGFTASYSSPEQEFGESDCASDLYQVGKIMEELTRRAGVDKIWKKFIEGTTAHHPDNRFSLEIAKNNVPGQNKRKNLIWLFPFLIILGVISIILFPKKQTQPIDIEVHNPIKDTVIIEKIMSPAIENPKETHKIDIRRVIDKKILDYTDNYYKTHLYPVCQKALGNEGISLSEEEEIELQKAIDKAYTSAMKYGESLSSAYPQEKNYIEKECLKSFEMKISDLLLKLYPTEDE